MKNLPTSPKDLIALLYRFHLVLFTVITVIILSTAILLLYGIVIKAGGEDIIPTNINSFTFDQATIDQINNLRTSSEQSEPLNFSNGRINPFSE